MAAKVDLMKSLEKSLVGTHRLTWEGPDKTKMIDSDSLAFCAWDYLKNRSPLVKQFENLKLVIFHLELVTQKIFTLRRNYAFIRGSSWQLINLMIQLHLVADQFRRVFQNCPHLRFKANPSPLRTTSPRSLVPSDCKNLLL